MQQRSFKENAEVQQWKLDEKQGGKGRKRTESGERERDDERASGKRDRGEAKGAQRRDGEYGKRV